MILFLGFLTVVYFLSLLGHMKVRSKAKNKTVEWFLWLLFSMWTLIFVLWGMSFIRDNYADFNKVLAVVPVALSFVTYVFINRKEISFEGFNKKDPR